MNYTRPLVRSTTLYYNASMTKKDRQHSIRIPSDLSDELQQLADADDRSFNYMVEQALRAYVESRRKPKGRK
jgi:metal-responsive CopG/Arc/MetJ family transcriptional regulator